MHLLLTIIYKAKVELYFKLETVRMSLKVRFGFESVYLVNYRSWKLLMALSSDFRNWCTMVM